MEQSFITLGKQSICLQIETECGVEVKGKRFSVNEEKNVAIKCFSSFRGIHWFENSSAAKNNMFFITN